MTRLALKKAESLGLKMLAWDDAGQSGPESDCQLGFIIIGLGHELGGTCLDFDNAEAWGPRGAVSCWGGPVSMDAWLWCSMELTWCWG